MTLVERVLNTLKEYHPEIFVKKIEEVINTESKITLVCPKHGEIKHSVGNILYAKCGCKKCATEKKIARVRRRLIDIPELKEFLDKYPPENPEASYLAKDYVSLMCKKHGSFQGTLKSLLRYKELKCPDCNKENNPLRENFSYYEDKLVEKYSGKYSYKILGEYLGAHSYISANCKKHGEWQVKICNHLHNNTECPSCSGIVSKGSTDLYEFVLGICPDAKREVSFNKNNSRMDIFIPSKNISIEYNGIHFHSSLYKPDNFHLSRREELEKLNIRNIIIWEDEWPRDKTKRYLEHTLGLSKNIYARKCSVNFIDKEVAVKFLNENHLMGYGVKCPEYVGIFFENKLLGCMGFKKGFHREFELYRASFLSGYRVTGGFSKMLNFWRTKNPIGRVISYIDLDKFDGRSYYKSGFKLDSINKSMCYAHRSERIPRHKYQKNKLKNFPNYSDTKTEKQILEEMKIYQCWNSGTARVVLE